MLDSGVCRGPLVKDSAASSPESYYCDVELSKIPFQARNLSNELLNVRFARAFFGAKGLRSLQLTYGGDDFQLVLRALDNRLGSPHDVRLCRDFHPGETTLFELDCPSKLHAGECHDAMAFGWYFGPGRIRLLYRMTEVSLSVYREFYGSHAP